MVFRPKFTSDGNPSDECLVLEGNPSSNINSAITIKGHSKPLMNFKKSGIHILCVCYS